MYGTTSEGGANGNYGTVFKISLGGSLTTLYSFGGTEGFYPLGLVQARNRDIYGTTESGGAYGYGAAFKIAPSGAFTTLYSFCAQQGCTDGEYPYAGLVQGADGDLYGTTTGFVTIQTMARSSKSRRPAL